jgi:hypothetical protein
MIFTVVTSRHVRTILELGIVVATLTTTGSAGQPAKPLVVYHDGARMLFTPQTTGTLRAATLGRWNLGERLHDEKLRERRLNLYVVFPGGQYRSRLHSRYNHTLVINKYTLDGQPREWDVFWCLVLDPSLPRDLRSENELLTATQQRFQPGHDFQFRRIPSHNVLADKLKVTNLNGLRRFRHKDGSLPRLLIIPAHLAVRATTARRAAKNAN